MEDLDALAATLAAGVSDARGSLILSRDGLVLGAHPEGSEDQVKPAWLRFAALGEPERGFVQFGTELWTYVRRGPYAAFVVTGTAVRPGLVIDRIEQVLLMAEEARARREPASEQLAPTGLPPSRPRAPLHPEPRQAEQPVVIRAEPSSGADTVQPAEPAEPEPDVAPEEPSAEPPVDAPASPGGSPTGGDAAPASAPPEPAVPPRRAGVWASQGGDGEEDEVDRFSLTREFSQLLQEDPNAADG